ncbi:MAG: hypothetical protein ACJA09_003129 [Alcanivorax sp.]|jgi:hypothetical protein
MFGRMLAVTLLVVGSLGAAQGVSATEVADQEATIIVYRADKNFKADRISMHLIMGGENLGRLNAGDSMVVSRPAGEYKLYSTIKGNKGLVMKVKSGQTYYVHTQMGVRGTQVKVKFAEVGEQVAKEHSPDIGGAI